MESGESSRQEMQKKLLELQALAEEYHAIFENSYDAIYISDANGITLKTNGAIERLTGIPKEYYIGKDLRYLEKRGILQKSVTFEVIKEKKPVTLIQENALGKVILSTGSPIFDTQGQVVRVVTNLRDISELNALREKLSHFQRLHVKDEPMVAASHAMQKVTTLVQQIADTDTSILLLGESGVGKEVVAKLIHRLSSRYEKGAFLKVNCGAIPAELLESELFGYDRGAFTGANKEGKPGLFELAHEGTLFLDEIAEMPLHLQVKLLRVLQEQEFMRVGGVKTIRVHVRIFAATNRDLKKLVSEGKFREDLYYRLCVVPIEIPPLRQRIEDILPLLEFYLEKFNRKYRKDKILASDTIRILKAYAWPGNIRELANFIERLIVITPTREIYPQHLPELLGVSALPTQHGKGNEEMHYLGEYIGDENSEHFSKAIKYGLTHVVEQVEYELILAAFRAYGSSYEVAKALQISQSTAIRKAYKYGIRMKSEEGHE